MEPFVLRHVQQENMVKHQIMHVHHAQIIVQYVLHQMGHLIVKVVQEFLFKSEIHVYAQMDNI